MKLKLKPCQLGFDPTCFKNKIKLKPCQLGLAYMLVPYHADMGFIYIIILLNYYFEGTKHCLNNYQIGVLHKLL